MGIATLRRCYAECLPGVGMCPASSYHELLESGGIISRYALMPEAVTEKMLDGKHALLSSLTRTSHRKSYAAQYYNTPQTIYVLES